MSFIKRTIDWFYTSPKEHSAPPEKELGTSGVSVFSGYLSSPETNSALAGIEKYRTFANTMVNTSIVGCGVRHFLRLVTGVSWKLAPPPGLEEESEDHETAEERAEQVSRMLFDDLAERTPWFRIVRRSAQAPFYGFSIQEITTRTREDGVKTLLDIQQRPQKTIARWHVRREGGLLGVGQLDPDTYQEIYLPRSKMLYVVDDSITEQPDGVGLLRHVVEPARRLARYEQLEGYGFETDLRGIPKAYAPIAALNAAVKNGDMTPAERDAALADVKRFMANHIKSPALSLLLDSSPFTDQGENTMPIALRQWDLELLKTDTGAAEPVNVTIERLNREIARVLGVEYLLLGGDSRGSQALSKDKTQALAALVQSTLDEIAIQVRMDVIGTIFRRNGWDRKHMPIVMPDAVRLRDVEEVIDTLVKLAQAGAPLHPNDSAINEVRAQIGITPAKKLSDEELALLQGVSTEVGAGPGGGAGRQGKPGSPAGGVEGGPKARPLPRPVRGTSQGTAKFWPPGHPNEEIFSKLAASGKGVMVALHLDPTFGERIALPGGEPVEELHITLAYLGKGLADVALNRVMETVYDLAAQRGPVTADLSGVGRFNASSTSDGKDVIYAVVDSMDITDLRPRLVQELGWKNVPVSRAHGYTPHVTLAYIPSDSPTPITRIEPLRLSFTEIGVSAGDHRIFFPFKG